MVSSTPLPLYPRGKSPHYPLDRRLGGAQSRSGRRGEVNILDPTGIRTATPLTSSPRAFAVPIALPRLSILNIAFKILISLHHHTAPPFCTITLRRRHFHKDRSPSIHERTRPETKISVVVVPYGGMALCLGEFGWAVGYSSIPREL
jgi:hypothetical protein